MQGSDHDAAALPPGAARSEDALLIHVGYHKTGTSWLQRHWFGDPARGFARVSTHDLRIPDPDPLCFDAEALRRGYAPRLAAARAGGGVPVISSERLSGNPHSGGYDRKEIAERLARVFPQARILIVLREQRAAILSSWLQYVRVGGTCPLREYVFPEQDGRLPMFRIEHFFYDRLIALYQRLFGAPNVRVELYERLRDEPESFAASVARFAGVEVPHDLPFQRRENRGLHALAIGLRRRLNPLLRRDSVNGRSPWCTPLLALPGRGLVAAVERLVPRSLGEPWQRAWQRWLAERLEGVFRASNRETAALTGLDLERHGYR